MDKMEQYMGWLPEPLVGPAIALLTIVIGYIIAKIAGAIVAGAINKTGLGRKAQTTGGNIGKSLSKAVFLVLWLVFIMMGLSRFPQLAEPLEGIKGMLNNIFGYVPQIGGAGLLFFIGYVLSNIFRDATTSTLEAAQVDNLVAKFSGEVNSDTETSNTVAKTVGGIMFAIVMFVFGIAALDVLAIESISKPLSDMLAQITGYLPEIVSAIVVFGLAIVIGKFVSKLVRNTLPAMGVDNILNTFGELDGKSSSNIVPSKIISTIVFAGIALMGAAAATDILRVEQLSSVFSKLLALGGSITMGAIIIGAGLFIADFISKLVTETVGATAGKVIKYVTMLLVTFMGLNQMGIGDEIVNTAFRSFVWAAAFAAGVGGALAFGLGGREWAKSKLTAWFPNKPKPRAKK